MLNSKAVIAGAVSGLIAAILVDVDAWRTGQGAFNLKKAIPRWIGGAVAGAIAALGLGGTVA
jgi:hypothetical protein